MTFYPARHPAKVPSKKHAETLSDEIQIVSTKSDQAGIIVQSIRTGIEAVSFYCMPSYKSKKRIL
jgi:hypothetical protein